ncbi:MAG: response regulator [Ruminococcaceae bacterium]|nr:response regulator [Oscillospiraceae bacterium]
MRPYMKVLLFGSPGECENVAKLLADQRNGQGEVAYEHTADLERFEQFMVTWMPSLIIVLADGASGLESVYRSRSRRPNLPVFWFSDDREFGMQSYRLDCAYFSTKPATREKINSALKRCNHIGISCTVPV